MPVISEAPTAAVPLGFTAHSSEQIRLVVQPRCPFGSWRREPWCMLLAAHIYTLTSISSPQEANQNPSSYGKVSESSGIGAPF